MDSTNAYILFLSVDSLVKKTEPTNFTIASHFSDDTRNQVKRFEYPYALNQALSLIVERLAAYESVGSVVILLVFNPGKFAMWTSGRRGTADIY